jgi:hypothetical protein
MSEEEMVIQNKEVRRRAVPTDRTEEEGAILRDCAVLSRVVARKAMKLH